MELYNDTCEGPTRDRETGALECPCELEWDAPDECEECPYWTYYVVSHTNEDQGEDDG